MKITVKIDNVEIIVDENLFTDRATTLKYSDQNKLIQETIVVIAEQVAKLQGLKNKEKI